MSLFLLGDIFRRGSVPSFKTRRVYDVSTKVLAAGSAVPPTGYRLVVHDLKDRCQVDYPEFLFAAPMHIGPNTEEFRAYESNFDTKKASAETLACKRIRLTRRTTDSRSLFPQLAALKHIGVLRLIRVDLAFRSILPTLHELWALGLQEPVLFLNLVSRLDSV